MRTSGGIQGSARTFLTHFFGRGLDDARYVVERYKSDYQGQIRPWRPARGSKAGRKEARKVMSLRAVQRLRPRARRDHRGHRRRARRRGANVW